MSESFFFASWLIFRRFFFGVDLFGFFFCVRGYFISVGLSTAPPAPQPASVPTNLSPTDSPSQAADFCWRQEVCFWRAESAQKEHKKIDIYLASHVGHLFGFFFGVGRHFVGIRICARRVLLWRMVFRDSCWASQRILLTHDASLLRCGAMALHRA